MARAIFDRVAALAPADRNRFLRRALHDPVARRQLALSPAQRRLWLLQRLDPDSTAYNVPAAFRFRGPLDPDALRAALTEVGRRHEALRSRFVDIDGEPAALLSAQGPDLRVLIEPGDGTDPEQTLRLMIADEVRRPFDLAREAPARAVLIRLSHNDHVFVLTVHHIVTDARSLDIMLSELSALYDARRHGRAAMLPEPAFQFADFTAWLDGPARAEQRAADLEYWTSALAGAPTELDVPLDFPRPARQTLRGATATSVFPAEVVAPLHEAARRCGTTPFVAFAAAYAVLLAHYSGQDDVLMGIPEAGRPRRPDFTSTVGMFVNTVVERVDLSGDPSFGRVLEHLRVAVKHAREHGALPLDALVQALGVTGRRDRNPLFQAFFAYHPQDRNCFDLAGVRGEPLTVDVGAIAFDLDLAVEALPDGSARVTLTYAADLFSPATVERMLRHLRRVVEAAARDVSSPVSSALVPDEPARVALATAARPPLPATVACLHDFVDQAVREHRDAVAITWGDYRVTYRELDEQANRLAWRLRELHARPDDLVAVCLPRDHRIIGVILGVLRAGCGYVPLDPSLPTERLRNQATDCGARLLVTDRARLDLLGGPHELPARAVCLDDPATMAALAGCPVGAPPPAAGPGNLAYALYTSGSTGIPKGVAVEHGSVVNLMEFYRGVLRPGDVAQVLGSTPIGFDATIFEYFATLSLGGAVHLVESVFDLAAVPDPDAITLIETTPSLLARLLDHAALPSALRLVLLSGEPLPPTLIDRIHAARPGARIIDIYGVTECTVDATWAVRTPGKSRRGLGEPLPGMRFYVLNGQGLPVPPGARGELHLAGPAVARGYVNDPALTRERFRPDPYRSGERMYRTGDVVRLGPDGELEYCGRTDRQVKVHGARVEPAEIEAVLTAHPAVRAAAILVLPTGDSDRGLVAYVAVGEAGRVPDDLRAHLTARLPRHMIPAAVIPLEALPLNANGKLDTAALAAVDAPKDAGAGTGAPTAPRTDTEHLLLTIWSEVLDRPVGIHDDFFAVGGHSMAALRAAARLRAVLGVDVPADTLFQYPTVAGLAEFVRSGGRTETCPRILRRHGSLPPLVLIHGAGGGVLSYIHLVQAFGNDRPVYGFEPIGLHDDRAPLHDIAAMAGLYRKRLADLSVDGPVVLVGWSVGGLIAYEMSRQAARGTPHVVVMVDTEMRPEGFPEGEAAEAVLKSHYMLLTSSSAARTDEVYDQARMTAEGLDPRAFADGRPPAEHLLEWARRRGLADQETSVAALAREARVLAANLRAGDEYVLRATPHPVLFLSSQADGAGRADPLIPLLGDQLDIVTVPGDHRSMLRPPHVAHLAAALTAWLNQLPGPWSGAGTGGNPGIAREPRTVTRGIG